MGYLETNLQLTYSEIMRMHKIWTELYGGSAHHGEMVVLPNGYTFRAVRDTTAAEPARCAYCGTRISGTSVKCVSCGAPI